MPGAAARDVPRPRRVPGRGDGADGGRDDGAGHRLTALAGDAWAGVRWRCSCGEVFTDAQAAASHWRVPPTP